MMRFLEILNITLISGSLLWLCWMLFKGQLREKSLALGPARDLALPLGVYHLGAMGVSSYVFLKLALGGIGQTNAAALADLLPLVLTGLMIGYMMRTEAGFRRIGLAPRHPQRDLKWGALAVPVALGLASFASWLMTLLSVRLNQPVDEVAHETLKMLKEQFSPGVLVGVVFGAVIFAPIIEEIVFRGILQTSLMRLVGGLRWPALVVSSALFSVTHWWVVPWQGLLPLFVLGLVFGYLYERTGSLLTPILAHAGFNAVNIAVALAVPMEAAG